MTTKPTNPIAADRSAGDAAALVPTTTPAPGPGPGPGPGPAEHVTAREIAEFLRHLARFRSPAADADPAELAALLARKAELFTRIAAQHPSAATGPPAAAAPTTPTAPEGHTP